MTISTEVRKAGPFVGNGSASVFPFAFKVFKAADLIVVRRQDNIGEETTLVLDSDYHVTLNGNQDTTPGGVVTLVAGALASGFTLVVSSELPYLQPTDLTNQGGFYPKVITNALDRLTIFCQQLAEITGRTLKLPITAPTNISAEIPLPNPSELIAWNETGTGLTTVSPQSLVTSIAYGSATADLFAGDGVTTTFPLSTNPASVNNLDVSVGGFSLRPVQGGIGDYSWNGGASITFAEPPPAPSTPGDKNVLVRYMQAIPVSDSEALHAQTREALRRSYAEAGYNLVDGSFETGGTLTSTNDVLLLESAGTAYAWTGAYPVGGYVVAPGIDPTVVPGYAPRTDVVLRDELASDGGALAITYKPTDANATPQSLQALIDLQPVTPERYGAKHTAGIDDSAAFHAAIATGKRLQLSANTYYVNLVLPSHFDIEGQGMDRTKLVAFDKTKPVILNMYQEPRWSYPTISSLTIEGNGTNEGTGFSFGDFDNYNAGDELIGRVKFVDVYFTNLDKPLLKCYGNIGNVFENVSWSNNNYMYYARASQVADPLNPIMHAGADLFIGCQITGTHKMCILILDNTGGLGQWTFKNTIFQFNNGGLAYVDVVGTGLSAYQSFMFDNIWNEGNATSASVTIDTLGGPQTITPSDKVVFNQFGPDYLFLGKIIQHGTQSTLGRVNIWGNERAAINLTGGGIGSGDYVDIAFSSEAYPTSVGAYIRSSLTSYPYGRDLSLAIGPGVALKLNTDRSVVIGEEAYTPQAGVTGIYAPTGSSVGSSVAEFAGPFGAVSSFNHCDTSGASSSLTGLRVQSIASTGRSINAAGTINASGADYAEYMLKSATCGTIDKGDVCGVTKSGELTDMFDESVSFLIKSTDPAYVGGDTWAKEEPPAMYSDAYLSWQDAINMASSPLGELPINQDELLELSNNVPEMYSDDYLHWMKLHEAERCKYDRIAFCGQVPCNVLNANPGEYIIPVRAADGSIAGTSVASPSFEQYKIAVGKVWNILEDGRAWIAVKPV